MEVNLILGRKYQKYSDNSMPLCSVIDSKAGIRGEESLDGNRVYGTYIQLYLAVICILYVISSHFLKANAILKQEIQKERGGQERMEKYQEGNNTVGFR